MATQYQLRYRKLGTTTWVNYGAPTSNLTALLAGLQVDVNYQASIVAVNPQGATTSVPVTFATTRRLPSSPGTPTASAVTQTGMVLNWSLSQLGSIPISYQVQMRVQGVGSFANVGASTTGSSLGVTGLTANTTYEFKVVASNSVGNNTSGTLTKATTAAGVVPAAITALHTTAQAQTSVSLAWTGSTAGTPPITYQPRFRLNGTTSFTSFGSPISGTSVTITGLTSNTSYNFEVDAINSVGTTASAILAATFTAPAPPTALSVTGQTSNSISITWVASPGAGLTYQVQSRLSSGGTFANSGAPTTVTNATISGLTVGTQYDIQVIAIGTGGSTTSLVLPNISTASANAIWNAADLSGMLLSGASTDIASSNTASIAGVRSVSFHSLGTGKFYAEMVATTANKNEIVGIANAALPLGSTVLGGDLNSIGWNSNGPVMANGAIVGGSIPAYAVGDTLCIAVDTAGKVFFRVNGGGWDGFGSGDDPSTGTGGYAFSIAGNLFLAFSSRSGGHTSGSQNTGASQPVITGPATITGVVSQTLAIPNWLITDSNQPLAGNCTLRLNAVAGTISVSGTTGITGNNTAHVTVVDTFANCQAALNSFAYHAPSSATVDSITVQLTQQSGLSNTLTVPTQNVTSDPSIKQLKTAAPFTQAVPTGYIAWGSSGVVIAPSAPTNLVTSNASGTTMDLSWTASAVGTPPIMYQPQYSTSAAVLPGAVTGLAAGTSTASTVPLSWVAPTSGTQPFTYHMQYKTSASSVWIDFASTSSTTSGTVTGLVAATSYDFRVFASNSVGNGAVSNVVAGKFTAGGTSLTPTFQDTFGTLSLHRTWQAGDNWQLIAPDTPDGRGGPNYGESGDMWWTNPFNPSTPATGLYSAVTGGLRLQLQNCPAGAEQTFINGQSGGSLPYLGCLLNSSQTIDQLYGKWEFVVAVDRVPGFSFQATIENVQVAGTFPPEIDLRVETDASGVQTAFYEVANLPADPFFTTVYSTSSATGFDARGMHTYGWEWTPTNLTFFLDSVQVAQIATPVNQGYNNFPAYIFLLTGANYIGNGDPNPASLPANALVQRVSVWQTTTTPPPPTVTGFSVSNGQIMASGVPFIAKGIGVTYDTIGTIIANSAGGLVLQSFPGTNMVKLTNWSDYTVDQHQDFINVVNWLTARNIVVWICDYTHWPNEVSGAGLTAETNWFSRMATTYKNNPYVWFGSGNEPQNTGGDISAEHLALYNAIRATGSNAMILFNAVGSFTTTGLTNTGIYATMHNVGWDTHYYNWISSFSTSLAVNQQALAAQIAQHQAIHSADGVMPVIIGEFGDATDGANIDAGWQATVQAIVGSAYGWGAWVYWFNSPAATGDRLVTPNIWAITPYGTMIKNAQSPAPPPPPTGGPGHGPTEFTPPNAQVIAGRSNGTNWGNILVSANVAVDTQVGLQFGNITYSAIECVSPGGWAEFGRFGEIKCMYQGCTAIFFADGIVLGPPDVAVDGNNTIWYTAGNYTGGAIIWRYADTGATNMVINDFSVARGDILNISNADPTIQNNGVTVTHPSWGTLMSLNGLPGSISLYGVTLNSSDITYSG